MFSKYEQCSTFSQSTKSTLTSPLTKNVGQASTSQHKYIPRKSSLFGESSEPSIGNTFSNASNSIFNQSVKTTDVNQMDTTPSQTSELFQNSLINDQLGTPEKFTPSRKIEMLPKGGILHIKYQSITFMKEYKTKSFEELRVEDYELNRKSLQMKQPSGSTIFNNTFVTTSASSVFDQRDNKPGYGKGKSAWFEQTSSGFGSTPMDTSDGMYKNVSATPTFPLKSATNNPFLNASANSSFGQPRFGAQPILGNQIQTNQNTRFFSQNTSVLNQKKNVSFNISTTSATVGIFRQPTALNTNLQFTGPANISAPNFCQPLFGHTNTLLNTPANKTTTPLFGEQKVNSLPRGGFPIGGKNSIFDSNASKPIFSSMEQMCSFGSTPNTYFNNNQQMPMQSNGPEQILLMASTPYGLSNLLSNTSTGSNVANYARSTNLEELNAILKRNDIPKTSSTEKVRPYKVLQEKFPFVGLEYYDENLVLNTRINKNPKRLIIRNKSEKIQSLDDIVIRPLVSDIQNENLNSKVSNINTKNKNESSDNISLDSFKTSSDVNKKGAGIILTRAEYYTVPPLNELVNYIAADGSCVVKGFTIGRLGYGKIYFPDAFDVSNLNLDEFLHFRFTEIIIYPDATKKPPVGQGLNRRAQVTLNNVWPRDKKTNILITNVNTLMEMDFAGSLRKKCEKCENQFVYYSPETGLWVFNINPKIIQS